MLCVRGKARETSFIKIHFGGAYQDQAFRQLLIR